MRAKPTLTMLLVPLACAFLLGGCDAQEPTSTGPLGVGPQFDKPNCSVDPSHPSCKDDDDGDGGDGKTAEVDPDAGVTAPSGQRIKKEADSPKKLNVNGVLADVAIALGDAATNCEGDQGLTELLDQAAADRKFVMDIDRKSSQPCERCVFRLKWPPDDITHELDLLRPVVDEDPEFGGAPTDATFTLTGGQVRIKSRPDDTTLTCDNGTSVEVAVRP